MSQTFTVYQPDGSEFEYEIEDGATLFAGSGSHCKVQLSGAGIQDIHCMLGFADDQLKIQNWNSSGETLINGQPVVEESVVGPMDEVSIGESRLRCGHSSVASGQSADAADSAPQVVTDSQGETATRETENVSADVPELDDEIVRELQRIHLRSSELSDTFVDLNEYLAGGETTGNETATQDFTDESFTASDYQLLRSEVENLQMELIEKDQQIIQLQHQSPGESALDDASHADTERLVSRMEELLDELQSTDDRARMLEELLRVSDEATQAEQEERRQLENWVEQIEERVSNRDEESAAEVNRLNDRVRILVEQQKQSEIVLERALEQRKSTLADDSASRDLLATLQDQVQDIKGRWNQVQEENEALVQQLKDRDNVPEGSPEAYGLLQQKVMQLEIDVSRERAEIARERADLMRAQADLEQQCRDRGVVVGADAKLKAVRDQLREQHAEEASERENRKAAGLGGRISRLFSRVEAR